VGLFHDLKESLRTPLEAGPPWEGGLFDYQLLLGEGGGVIS